MHIIRLKSSMKNIPGHDYSDLQGLREVILSWGHNLLGKTISLLDEISLIRMLLTKETPDINYILSRLDIIEQLIEEISETPSPYHLENTHITTFLEKTINRIRQRASFKDVDFEMDLASGESIVRVNPIWFSRVIDIVIDNAVDAMSKNDEKKLRLSSFLFKDGVEIRLRDNGKGIEQKLKSELFHKPLQNNMSERGRGLFIAKLIIDVFNGKIYIYSTSKEGTTIAIWLPLSR